MADLSKIKLNGTEYDLKDTVARDSISILSRDFNGEIAVSPSIETERVAGGTLIKNTIWPNKGNIVVGYNYDLETEKICFSGIISNNIIYPNNQKKFYCLYEKDSTNSAYELTFENAPEKYELVNGKYNFLGGCNWNLSLSGVVQHIDFRVCSIYYDNNNNEIERIYSAQYRYTVNTTTGVITRIKTNTEKISPDYLIDIGLISVTGSSHKTANLIGDFEEELLSLNSTNVNAQRRFIIPDSYFDNAPDGLSIITVMGDGTRYISGSFKKAVAGSSEEDITANTNARHTHSNKALLDTYTQTETNLADAVSKKHTHSNKSALDDITAEKISAWDNGVINHADKTDLPLIVTGTCAFGTSLINGTDTPLAITNTSHTVSDIAEAISNNRPIYIILNDNSMKLMLQYSAFDGTTYYFTNAYDPFTATAYNNESFNITVKATNSTDISNSTYDTFTYIITYNKNAFVTQSDMNTAINEAIGGITEFDTQVVQSLPQTGVEGTIYFTPNSHGANDAYDEFIYVNNTWEKIGNTQVDLTGYVRANDLALVATSGDYNNLNNTPNIPEKTSDLTNDSGFVNVDTAQDIAWLNFDGTYITDPWKMSELGPLTGNDVYAEYIMTKKAVPIVIYNNSLYYYQSGNSNTDIKYFNPENNTILTHSNNSSIVSINTRTIFSGDYNDLSNKPTLFDGDYNSLSNKPTLFSGSYNDLSDKPTIPSATTVTQTISSGVKIAEINGTAIYAPAYANGDQIAY